MDAADADPTAVRSDGSSWAWPAALLPPAAAAWWSSATAAGADAARTAARMVPSYAHFGQNVTPVLPEVVGERLPAASPAEPALAARLAALAASLAPDTARLPTIYTLNAHRVSTYRKRLASIVAAAAGDGAPRSQRAGGDTTHLLSPALAPRLHPATAVAVMPLLPPPPPDTGTDVLSALAPASAWASVRRAADAVASRARGVVGGDAPPPPDRAAAGRHRRRWRPGHGALGARVRPGARLVWRHHHGAPSVDSGPCRTRPRRRGRARAAIVAGRGAAAAAGDTVALWLRSDFDEAVVDVTTLLPTVWVLAADADACVSLGGGARAVGATAAALGGPLARAAAIVHGVALLDASVLAGDQPPAQAAAVASALGGGSRWAAALALLPRAAAVWLPSRAAGARAGARAAAALPPAHAGARVPTVVAVTHAGVAAPGALAEVAAAAAAVGACVVPLGF